MQVATAMHILFVDDVKDTRNLYSLFFQMNGHTTTTAKDGMEALVAVQKTATPFDVVVLDVDMPNIDGWQALGALRELPQARHLPVVMFSAHSRELRTRSEWAGANGILEKPATPSQVLEKIQQVTEAAKQSQMTTDEITV